MTLGSTEQVLFGCEKHSTFLLRLTGLTWREDGLKNKEISLLKPRNRTYLRAFLNESLYPPLELVKKDTVPNHIGLGRVLDAYWIDHITLRCWYERCCQRTMAKSAMLRDICKDSPPQNPACLWILGPILWYQPDEEFATLR